MKQFAIAYIAMLLVLSVTATILYGFDKRRAKTNGRRVPEKTLHLVSLFGGWPGALVGQKVFRHKTQKTSFRIQFWFCVVLHIAVVAGVVYLFVRHG